MFLTFGTRLRMAREHKGYSQMEVAKKTGINNKSLSHYENDVSSPDIQTITALAKVYDVSTDYLFGLIEKFKHPELNSFFKDPEIMKLVDSYKGSEQNIKNAVKALLEIASDTDVKKENSL